MFCQNLLLSFQQVLKTVFWTCCAGGGTNATMEHTRYVFIFFNRVISQHSSTLSQPTFKYRTRSHQRVWLPRLVWRCKNAVILMGRTHYHFLPTLTCCSRRFLNSALAFSCPAHLLSTGTTLTSSFHLRLRLRLAPRQTVLVFSTFF